MAVRPTIPGACEVVIRGHFVSNNQPYITVLGAKATTLTSASCAALAAHAQTALRALAPGWSNDVYMDSVDVKSVDAGNPVRATALLGFQGSRVGPADSPAKCKVIVLHTAIAERYGSGRVYFGGVCVSDQNLPQDNKFLPTPVQNFVDMVNGMGAACTDADFTWSVLSYKEQKAYPVISASAPNAKINFRTQRSEGN